MSDMRSDNDIIIESPAKDGTAKRAVVYYDKLIHKTSILYRKRSIKNISSNDWRRTTVISFVRPAALNVILQ